MAVALAVEAALEVGLSESVVFVRGLGALFSPAAVVCLAAAREARLVTVIWGPAVAGVGVEVVAVAVAVVAVAA